MSVNLVKFDEVNVEYKLKGEVVWSSNSSAGKPQIVKDPHERFDEVLGVIWDVLEPDVKKRHYQITE